MKELIEEAKNRVDEIVQKSKNEQPESYLAIYESENGYTVSWIRKRHDTRTNMIAFGAKKLSRSKVLETIAMEEQYV